MYIFVINNVNRMNKVYIGLILLLSFACNSKKPSEQAFQESMKDVTSHAPAISQEVLSDIIQQIPSPLEISVLLKESGTNYDKGMLNGADKVSDYNSNFSKALNLGIYGTDLGYANIYEQNQDALFYLNAIRRLAEGLSIGQFFDFTTISRLATNSKNLDSLLLITTRNFNNINSYLQQQERANLSILILAGGWLEALHISNQVLQKNPDNIELREKVGEQKIILENIMLLLSYYEQSDPNISELKEKMTPLQEVFNKVKIAYTYEESTFEEVNGVLMIKDNSSSSIQINDENIADINSITKSIRSSIIN